MKKDPVTVLSSSAFSMSDEPYAYVKVNNYPADISRYFMISTDPLEISVLTRKNLLNELDVEEVFEVDMVLITIDLSVPFTKGVIATIATKFYEQDMNCLVVSTFSRDYIITRNEDRNKARTILLDLGLTEKGG